MNNMSAEMRDVKIKQEEKEPMHSADQSDVVMSEEHLEVKHEPGSCVDLKKEWTVVETLKLIEVYKKIPCLWNPKHPKYDDELVKGKTLEMLGASFGTSEGEIQEMLLDLQNQYTGEVLKEETDGTYKSKWVYFESLKFLSTKGNGSRKRNWDLSNGVQSSKKSQEENEDKYNMPSNDNTSKTVNKPTKQINNKQKLDILLKKAVELPTNKYIDYLCNVMKSLRQISPEFARKAKLGIAHYLAEESEGNRLFKYL